MKRLLMLLILSCLIIYAGCAPKAPKKEPGQTIKPVEVPMKLDLPKDEQMYKAYWVLKRYGNKTQAHMSYTQYKKNTSASDLSFWSPDWFYDSYQVPVNEKGHWITVTYHTATAAMRKDRRIEKLMENVPHHSIDIKLKTPNGAKYILTDTEADGVLDFAAPDAKKRNTKEVKADFPLLKRMQGKYTWILGIIKQSYKLRSKRG
jgi:hypothetical protein